ncbi:KpsF/GutQ family sugar-phosphate isomerase [Candidatus Bandiella woodruffii]|uniref:KpsF/GutQ family sugar-phosphate isomerase n=1 Tax=Candidatus Bandiella euplotis TaxID=1664265 RepID=A0ABZ0USX1_9RICK|nr:KpsF/GutQ family sugar-phosphate isomerase [Candidatus Bandiella woodruffii]
MESLSVVQIAKQVIKDEIAGLNDLYNFIDEDFQKIVQKIMDSTGRLVFSGMGKSGYVARKISATLSSIGVASFFIHPAEAGHGDLGMIAKDDVVVLMSNSGDTFELNTIIDYCKRFNIFIIGVTRKKDSMLSKISDLPIVLPNSKEASDIGMPSTSVIVMIAFWDAVTIALQKLSKFSQEEFKILHPGGKIGAKLLKVSKIMHKKEFLPIVYIDAKGAEVVLEMTQKGFGCTAVLDRENKLVGIITDGDLRRHMDMDFKKVAASEMMNKRPITVKKSAFASEVMYIMNANKITQIFVMEEDEVVGIVHMHDLVRAGIA